MIFRMLDALFVRPINERYIEADSSERELLRSLEQGILPTVLVDHRSDAVVFINYLLATWLPVDIQTINFLRPQQTWREMAKGLADKLSLPRHLQNTDDAGGAQHDAVALEDIIDLDHDRVVRRLCRTTQDADGRYLGHLYQFEEVSREVHRRRNLRRAANHYRTLVEISADWTWSWHRKTSHVLCVGTMRGASGNTGLFYQDCQGEMHAIPDMKSMDWQPWLTRLQAQETFRDLVVHSQDAIGFNRVYLVSGAPSHDSTGAFIGFTGSAIDQTSYRMLDTADGQAEGPRSPTAWARFDTKRH